MDRNFTVRLPQAMTRNSHYPVVFVLHGMNQDPDDMERLTRFDELADKDGIIAVYPAALHGRWNVGVRPPSGMPWRWGPEAARRLRLSRRRRRLSGRRWRLSRRRLSRRWWWVSGGGQQRPRREPEEQSRASTADDVAFFNQMLDQLESKFSVDSSRIYALGLSEGGFMSMRLGCALGDRFAAMEPSAQPCRRR